MACLKNIDFNLNIVSIILFSIIWTVVPEMFRVMGFFEISSFKLIISIMFVVSLYSLIMSMVSVKTRKRKKVD